MPSPDTEAPTKRDVRRLARLYGLETEYWDVFGQRRHSPAEAVVAVLRSLGAPVSRLADCHDAMRQRRIELWERRIEPVVPVREGPAEVPLRHVVGAGSGRCRWELTLESGGAVEGEAELEALPEVRRGRVDGREMVARRLPVPDSLPPGYHDMELELDGERLSTLLICAPEGIPRAPAGRRGWGLFAPLYALRGDPDRGIGSYEELDGLARLVDGLGGASVATLPLLPVDAHAPGGPSPYAPLSRLFWAEHHLHLEAIPELRLCPEAGSPHGGRPAGEPSGERRPDAPPGGAAPAPGIPEGGVDLVDYPAVTGAIRRVLEPLAATFFAGDGVPGERRREFRRFLDARPEVRDYARFRALAERHGSPWWQWPAAPRGRRATDDDYDEGAYRTHLYAQWLAHRQLDRVAGRCREREQLLYLDLPLGVPEDSYDVWRHRESFCRGVSVGAPPDTFFLKGQNWAFPPPHPGRIRERGHDYLRACLRHHLSVAGMLRLDHVMGLHRLYWIPGGFDATEGVYVRYPSRELWAILRLEAARAGVRVVGEDLGTVPPPVRRAMEDSGAHRMFVVQTEVAPERLPALDPVPGAAVASLNTHDMPTFAGFWQHRDLETLHRLGHMDDETAAREADMREARKQALVGFLEHEGMLSPDRCPQGDDESAPEADPSGGPGAGPVSRAALRWLAGSAASELIVNVEDLWLETEPQNVPGTSSERPNWRRRLPCPLDRLQTLGPVKETLAEIDRRRRRARPAGPGDTGPGDTVPTAAGPGDASPGDTTDAGPGETRDTGPENTRGTSPGADDGR